MLPPIERKEWLELVMGTLDPPITSHLLKIRLNTLRKKVKRKMISSDEAVLELYNDCMSYQDIYRNDLHTIFPKESANLI